MLLERNKTVAQRWFLEMWNEPDLSVADEIIDPDYDPEWVQIPTKGPDQVKHEIRYFRSVFPDLVYEMVDLVAQEDKVWVRYRASGTQSGSAWGFEATGKNVHFEGATIFTISDQSRIIDRWGAFSLYDVLVDLGLAPPLWELNRYLNWDGD
jgi:predicted ester cyclase